MEKLSVPVGTLETKPSIEDPLTLTHEELISLREAAIEVMNTHTREEAEKIFLVGLKPVKVAPKEHTVVGK